MGTHRIDVGGFIYHAFNRAIGRAGIFAAANDYLILQRSMASALRIDPVTLHAYALMPNHWHLLVETHADGALSRFVHRLTSLQARLWHELNQTRGEGHLYQGPFVSSLITNDAHFYATARYVERNPLAAKLVERAEMWPWGSLYQRTHTTKFSHELGTWPIQRPRHWPDIVNASLPSDTTRGAPKPEGASWFRDEVEKRLMALREARPKI